MINMDPTPAPIEWQRRVGKYKIVNPDTNQLLKSFELVEGTDKSILIKADKIKHFFSNV